MRNRMKVLGFYKLAAILGVLMCAAPFTAYGADGAGQTPPAKKQAATAAKSATAASTSNPCPYPVHCDGGGTCRNYPFKPTDCWTTPYGPAKADVIIAAKKTAISSTNMLLCEGNQYALCFFSGPPTKTGKSSSNNDLPCVLGPGGAVASCTCQAYTSGPNFVDINGILNRGVYFETVKVCGQDGSGCKNIVSCFPQNDPKKQAECQKLHEPPVCKYVKNQSASNPQGSLMPKADLISTFSFAMSPLDGKGPYVLGATECSGLYAGCMTAPCSFRAGHTSQTHDGELVTCQCPTYNGKSYQVGQSGQSCSIVSDNVSKYVWSASNTVSSGSGQ
ncbi:MAG: hypothetical protein ACJ76Y_15325 [Thermoanaerobaculia bacterium]